MGLTSSPVTNSSRPSVAPVMASTCPNPFAPATMRRIMVAMRTTPMTEFASTLRFNRR